MDITNTRRITLTNSTKKHTSTTESELISSLRSSRDDGERFRIRGLIKRRRLSLILIHSLTLKSKVVKRRRLTKSSCLSARSFLTEVLIRRGRDAGYDVPVGINVEFYLPAINEDPKLWSDPKKFNPDRFISGKEDADITGVKMMPFGVGRRICPGLPLATVHVHLMLAKMVQEFEWSAYPPGSEINFAGKLEFTVVMKEPLRAMVKSRA
ncbi:PREDICTED: cytochrome P450 77A4-like [Camelina sativa]|uniref:Cytochrome P450 77A4-like n=1 Tax=Camelina sativa TaxID=90675 RepID=A0ABM1Q756_CAMSA|nr:PREDICTED: cytochrome P450 77A4-like [Camelina sativa]